MGQKQSNRLIDDDMYYTKMSNKIILKHRTGHPPPLAGKMPTKMVEKTEDSRIHSKQQQIEAGIKKVKKAIQIPQVNKEVSAANPLSGTLRE